MRLGNLIYKLLKRIKGMVGLYLNKLFYLKELSISFGPVEAKQRSMKVRYKLIRNFLSDIKSKALLNTYSKILNK